MQGRYLLVFPEKTTGEQALPREVAEKRPGWAPGIARGSVPHRPLQTATPGDECQSFAIFQHPGDSGAFVQLGGAYLDDFFTVPLLSVKKYWNATVLLGQDPLNFSPPFRFVEGRSWPPNPLTSILPVRKPFQGGNQSPRGSCNCLRFHGYRQPIGNVDYTDRHVLQRTQA